MMKYESIRELVTAAESRGCKISELVLADQAESMEQSPEEIYEQMRKNFEVMRESVAYGQRKEQRSMSGLTGGEGFAMKEYAEKSGGGLCGTFLTHAISPGLGCCGLQRVHGPDRGRADGRQLRHSPRLPGILVRR